MENDTQPQICDYEGSTYQDTFWETGEREYEDRAEDFAIRQLLPKAGNLLLEVGAGAGRNTPRYAGYEKIVLLDFSVTQLEQAQERLGTGDRYIYVAADAYRMPFVDGLFDGATMIRVLHHMADGPRVLGQVRRVMRTGGIFILEYANKRNFKAILRRVLKKQTWSPFDPEPVEFVDLNFNFHPRTTRNWLSEAGFLVQKQMPISHFRLGALKNTLPAPWLVAGDAVLSAAGSWIQLSPSVFVRSRVEGPSDDAPPPASPEGWFICPDCGSEDMEENEGAVHCRACGHDWQKKNGIYVFK